MALEGELSEVSEVILGPAYINSMENDVSSQLGLFPGDSQILSATDALSLQRDLDGPKFGKCNFILLNFIFSGFIGQKLYYSSLHHVW